MTRKQVCLATFVLLVLAVTHVSVAQARYYHPSLGRWITRDPSQYADGPSLYEYVRTAPTTSTDPTGMATLEGNWRVFRMRIARSKSADVQGQRVQQVCSFELAESSWPCCSEVDIIQAVESHAVRSWLPDIHRPFALDLGGREAPLFGNAEPTSPPPRVKSLDVPGAKAWYWKRVETLKQTFETCAVCTKGIEKGQIISCVQWGHKWEYFGKAAGSYLYDVMLWAALAERRVMAFINADTGKYEPEKSWFYDPALKGYRLRLPEGGEMIELVGYKGTPPSAALRGLVAGYGYFYREPVP